jgi:hypothetical protein
MILANLSGLRADDDIFQLPISTATGSPVTSNAPSAGVTPTVLAAPVPTAAPAPAAVPATAADRWARRNQQMRDAALQSAAFPASVTPAVNPSGAAFPAMELPPSSAGVLQPTAGFASQVPPAPIQAAGGLQQQVPPAPAPAGAYMAQAQRLPFSGKFSPGTARQGAIPDLGNLPEAEQVSTPAQLPKVTQIMPYLDYEPDPKVAAEDPCQNLCPRPDGAPCKTIDGKGPECPREIQLSNDPFVPRTFPASTYTWQASNIFYQPLYFEDPDLERYGHAWPFFIQPIVSSVRFTTQAVGIPYQMVIDPCCCRVYPLGYYRPGECAPKLIYQIPWNTQAAAAEAGVITGVYFLFPHSAWAM